MAPAAKLSRYGRAGTTSPAAQMVNSAPTGSTAPDSVPAQKARSRLMPSAFSGIEIMAPSGKFWMAMPRDSASAPIAVMDALPVK